MSKINPALYSSAAHDWMTPPGLICNLLEFLNRSRFDVDVATTQKNIPAANHFVDGIIDGLSMEWDPEHHIPCVTFSRYAWMNPPYGTQLPKWVEKAYRQAIEYQYLGVWGLIPARPDTRYWHNYVFSDISFVVFLQGRLRFLKDGQEMKGDGSAPFPTALVYWGHDWEAMATQFNQAQPIKGTLMTRKRDGPTATMLPV